MLVFLHTASSNGISILHLVFLEPKLTLFKCVMLDCKDYNISNYCLWTVTINYSVWKISKVNQTYLEEKNISEHYYVYQWHYMHGWGSNLEFRTSLHQKCVNIITSLLDKKELNFSFNRAIYIDFSYMSLFKMRWDHKIYKVIC